MDISAKNSNFLINNHFSKVFKRILEKKSKNETIASELEWINTQLISDNRKICENASTFLVHYGEKIDIVMALNTFLSAFSRIKNDNFDLIFDGIIDLLVKNNCVSCQITEKPHPAILLLKDSNAAKMMYLSEKIQGMLDSKVNQYAIKFFHPVLVSMLCSNEIVYSESRNVWQSLLETGSDSLVQEIISLRRVTSPSTCLLSNSMLLLTLKNTKNFRSLDSLLLLLSSTKRMSENQLDIGANIEILKKNISTFESNPDCGNLVLFLIAEILQITSMKYIPRLSLLIEHLIVKSNFGSAIVLHMIIDGLIQALAYPSFMSNEMHLIEKLVNFIRSRKFTNEPKKIAQTTNLQTVSTKMDPNLSNAFDMCVWIEAQDKTFQFLPISHDNEKFFWTRNQLVLRGFFHAIHLANIDFDQWKIVLANLLEISTDKEELKSSLVMPMLFRLTESFDPRIKISILQNLTALGASSDVFSTIKALSSNMLRSMTIDLFLRLWKIEPRIYPFLHKSLIEKSEHDNQDLHLTIIRAAAIKDICDLKPHHGSDLVSVISQILNESIEMKNSDISAALAIDSISLLCQNHIISIMSTWKAISLSTRYEKRPRVIKSLCDFFAIVPQFKRNNLEYENFNKEIFDRLFHMVQWSNTFGMQCALNALKSWSHDSFTLDMIPDVYRENIELPKPAPGMEVSIFDLEVPGECFVQLLVKVDESARKSAGELLSHYIRLEISDYRSGHYIVQEGQAEPVSYKKLPKQSIVRALVHFVITQATTKKTENIVDESIVAEALYVLAQKYPRPLPPLNWTFLYELMNRSSNLKSKCLGVAAKQAVISGTAKRIVDNFLLKINEENNKEDAEIALEFLPDLCNGASSDVLKLYFEKICTCFDAHVMDEKIFNLLSREKDVTNRENLAMIISFFINSRKASDVSVKTIKAFPANVLNVIHLPTDEKIRYRCEIMKESSLVDNPAAWLNELVIEQLAKNNDRARLISSIGSLLAETKTFPKKKWLNEFIIIVQNKMVGMSSLEESDMQFLLDIFVVAIVTMSGYFKIKAGGCESSYRHLFPQSVELLSYQESYRDLIGSIFEFMLYVQSFALTPTGMRTFLREAIVMSKNHAYFKKLSVWQKVLQLTVSA